MQPSGWIQFALYVVALVLITKPMGLYLLQVLDANGKTWLDPVLRPLERATYRVMGVDPNKSTTGSNTPSPCCSSAWSVVCSPTPFCGCKIFCRSIRKAWPG